MGRMAWVCIEFIIKRAIIVSDEGSALAHGLGLGWCLRVVRLIAQIQKLEIPW